MAQSGTSTKDWSDRIILEVLASDVSVRRYRQQAIFASYGLNLPHSSEAAWIGVVAERLSASG